MTSTKEPGATPLDRLQPLPRGVRLRKAQRDQVRRDVVACYEAGSSVRRIATALDRSYGTVYRLLEEAGVDMRARGGANSHTPAA